MRIADRTVGPDVPPLVVAEMSGNHSQSLDTALAIVDAAADAGAHALKLQTYTADTITLDVADGEFRITDPDSLWAGRTLYDLYQEAHTPWEWHAPIMERARERGLICFSAPFDESAVDFLEELDVPCYKIASFESGHLPLLEKVARTGKPVILSTGMAQVSELDEAVRTLHGAGCSEVMLLKCTSTYPASPQDSNLRTLPHLRELFDCEVGLSDHTLGLGVAVASVALGATLLEKHFTLDRSQGVDGAFSLEPPEMTRLVEEVHRAWLSLGRVAYGPGEKEERSRLHRRSLYVARDMEAGERFDEENLRVVRPGAGLHPRHYRWLLGRPIKRAATKGTPVRWDLLYDDELGK